MEVHHHTPTPGKKWTHYLWEFLMLFLAVFCGFMAENIREHKIEIDKEQQFIRSLVSDLKDDVKNLEQLKQWEQTAIAMMDTLITLLDNPQLARNHGDQLYYVARVGPRSGLFANNSRTFDQLKNSGGFRLIRSSETSNKIMSYYTQFTLLRLLEDNYNREFDDFKRIASKIFDPGIFRKQEDDKGVIQRSTDNPALRSYDPELLKELGLFTVYMNGSRRSKLPLLENLKKSAGELILYLKSKYHLE